MDELSLNDNLILIGKILMLMALTIFIYNNIWFILYQIVCFFEFIIVKQRQKLGVLIIVCVIVLIILCIKLYINSNKLKRVSFTPLLSLDEYE